MKKLSLAELKSKANNLLVNLEAIKGGDMAECHNGNGKIRPVSQDNTTVVIFVPEVAH
jgi:hypothetical protein